MKAKYDIIGNNYNRTRKADPYLTNRILHFLEPKSDGFYLDIGCGTGNYTSRFQQLGFRFMGLDPSKKMLEIAKLENDTIFWKVGTAENSGLPSNFFDGIVASLTLHHWTNLKLAFLEIQRILKPNGRIVIFTSTPDQMQDYWLNHYFPKMLKGSIEQMPDLKEVKYAMDENQITILEMEKYMVKMDLEDHFLYSGKHRPELYLNENIRQGISSFSSLANHAEINLGLAELAADIKSGYIKKVIESYKKDDGDYLFIVGEKIGSKILLDD